VVAVKAEVQRIVGGVVDPRTRERRDKREPESGVARRRLDNRAARLEAPVLFRRFDHRAADAILDGSTGILAFQLQEQLARAGVHTGYLDQGRISNQVE